MPPRTLAEALLLHAAERPDAIALRHSARPLSWTTLLSRVRALAAGLAARGVQPGSRIAALLPNHPILIELMLAAHWLGASLCPLNWRLSSVEAARHIAQLAPDVLVAHGRFARLVDHVDAADLLRIWCAGDSPTEEPDGFASLYLSEAPAPPMSASPDLPALLVSTSGTNGDPRHVILSHRALIASAEQFIDVLGLSHRDRQLAVSPLFHIAGLGVFTLPLLLCGGESVLSDGLDADALWERLCVGDISCIFMVPTLWARLLDAADARRPLGLRAAVVGGAFCPQSLRDSWIARGVPLWIGYGMTEAAPMVTLLPPSPRVSSTDVGIPGPEISLAIESPDADGIGRVCILAPNVMAGYWRDPDATSSALSGDGWLRTEDMGWIDLNDHLHLVGRSDDIIICGGSKIHPAEVELALANLPGIAEIAVVGTPHPAWGHLVTAILHPTQDPPPTLQQLHDHLAHLDSLARFKWPRRLAIRRHELPRSGAGKLLRRALLIDPREIIEERLPSPSEPT
jgi:fatty-acyl-CoA synthase